jgi:hypothetical protein
MSKRIIIVTVAAIGMAGIVQIGQAGIRIDFDRDNNTYNWLTSFNHTIGPGANSIRSYFDGQSNLIKGSFDRWQENASAGFDSEVSIESRLKFIASGEYTVNGLDRRRVKTSELAMGFSLKPARSIELRPLVRADNKRRSELEAQLDEKGLGYGIEGRVIPVEFSRIHLSADLSYNKVNLSNIPRQESKGDFSASTSFTDSDTLSVSLRGLEATTKYYGPGGKVEDITRQIKQERQAEFALSMALPAEFRLMVDGNSHLSRYLYRRSQLSDIPQSQRDNYGRGGGYEIRLTGNILDAARISAGYTWGTTGEDFQGLELDQDTDTGELSFHGKIMLSNRDTVSADVVFGVTSYSNPNAGSARDDRDQKTIMVNGGYSHVFSKYFSAGLTGGVNSFHQIYISGASSANNSRNDTYILTPLLRWIPHGRLYITQSFDIQANYITFDFDRKKIATKNRIFRRATSRTEVKVVISERLTLTQGYLYRYEDYGQLIWDDGWQQAVSWDRRRNGLETRVFYEPIPLIRISPYFLWEKTGDYNHAVEPSVDVSDPLEIRYLKDEEVKMLFQFQITFHWSDRRSIMADFSHRLRKFMDRPREINDYIRVSMEYLF